MAKANNTVGFSILFPQILPYPINNVEYICHSVMKSWFVVLPRRAVLIEFFCILKINGIPELYVLHWYHVAKHFHTNVIWKFRKINAEKLFEVKFFHFFTGARSANLPHFHELFIYRSHAQLPARGYIVFLFTYVLSNVLASLN